MKCHTNFKLGALLHDDEHVGRIVHLSERFVILECFLTIIEYRCKTNSVCQYL